MLAATLASVAPVGLRAQTAAKPKSKPHTKAAPKAVKKPAAAAAEPVPHVSQDTADRVHAWVAQQQRDRAAAAAANLGASPEDSKPPARPAPKSTAAKTMPAPESPKSAPSRAAAVPESSANSTSSTNSTKATAADFDKAVEGRSAAPPAKKPAPAKPNPGTPVTKPIVLPQAKLTYRHGRLVMPSPLFGSHEILVHQNQMADSEGLDRIQDSDDLAAMREKRLLVAIPAGAGLRVDPRLSSDRRYTRPWTAKFLADIARAHAAKFQRALQVNSAVRTIDFQARLIQYNDNAAPIEGADASPHLTGQAVDIAKKGLNKTEIAWMRAYLAPLIEVGKIDVEEEFQQACFHISVYRSYAPAPIVRKVPKRQLADDTHRPAAGRAAAALATAVP